MFSIAYSDSTNKRDVTKDQIREIIAPTWECADDGIAMLINNPGSWITLIPDHIFCYTPQEQYTGCPKCGCSWFCYEEPEQEWGMMWRDVACPECEFEFREVYLFSHNEDVTAGYLLDQNGEEA